MSPLPAREDTPEFKIVQMTISMIINTEEEWRVEKEGGAGDEKKEKEEEGERRKRRRRRRRKRSRKKEMKKKEEEPLIWPFGDFLVCMVYFDHNVFLYQLGVLLVMKNLSTLYHF